MKHTNYEGQTAEVKAPAMAGGLVVGNALDALAEIEKALDMYHGDDLERINSIVQKFKLENDLERARQYHDSVKRTLNNTWKVIQCYQCGQSFYKYTRQMSRQGRNTCEEACRQKLLLERKKLST
jgi:hypothetical protein